MKVKKDNLKLKMYKQGELAEDQTKAPKMADNLPDGYDGNGQNVDAPKQKKSYVDGKIFSMADERDY